MMQPAMQHRRGRSMGSMAKERDEDLALFHEMQKRDRERRTISSPVDDGPSATKSVSSSMYRIPTPNPAGAKGADDLLTSDLDKNDYDWLLTPPGTPLFSTLDVEGPGAGFAQKVAPLARSLAALKTSRLANSKIEASTKTEPSSKPVRGNLGLRQPYPGSNPSSTTNLPNRRSSLAPGPNTASRPSTPTGRSIIPSSTKPTSSSRPSTPQRRPTTPNLHQSNSSSMTGRSASASKASSLPSRTAPSSRGSSPTTRPRAWQPSAMPGFSLEPPPNLRTTMPERSTSNTRGASVGSRPGAPTTTRTVQDEAPDVSIRSRRQSCSPSVTRGRLTHDNIQSNDRTVSRNGKLSNGAAEASVPIMMGSKMVDKVMQARRAAAAAQNDPSTTSPNSQLKRPVKSIPSTRESSGFGPVKSTPMTRESSGFGPVKSIPTTWESPGFGPVKSIPTTRESQGFGPVKSIPATRESPGFGPAKSTATARESSGFGRNLSKKSLDMAIRHMDIRRSTPGGFRPLISTIPASSLYSVRSGSGRGRTSAAADSPIATSSNASSEHSMNIVPDLEGSEHGDEASSERCSKASPVTQPDSMFSLSKEGRLTNWVGSPDYRDDSVELMQLFRQGIERFSGSESPLICQHGGASDCGQCKIDLR